MTIKTKTAIQLFDSGLNCSQSVLSVFCEKYGMDNKTALKIASGLGSGFRSGEICGAVSGGVLVVGLKYGHCDAADKESKINCNAKTVEFLNAFKQQNNSIVCRELLGCNIATPAGLEHAQKNNLFRTTCVEKVKNAVELLEQLGY